MENLPTCCPKCGSDNISYFVDMLDFEFQLDEDGGLVVDIDDAYDAIDYAIGQKQVKCKCWHCNAAWNFS